MAALGKVWTVALLAALGGCAWLSDPQERAAVVTEAGVSPLDSERAVWLAAPRPGLSVAGKDYLFVGPMRVNRDGVRQAYLWFGFGTTLDRRLTGAPKPELDAVVLMVDGAPMSFDLIAWDDGADASPYPLPIESDVSYAARVTASQMRQLAYAVDLGAYVTDAEGRSPLYSLVRGSPGDWLLISAARDSATRSE